MKLDESPFLAGPEYRFIDRSHIFYTSLVAFSASLAYFLVPGFPFHPGFCATAAVSGAFHFALYLFFKRLSSPLWDLANYVNTVLLGFAVHYSGGILSPFSIFFIFILLSGAGYGVRYPAALGVALLTFLTVTLGESLGLWPPIPISNAAVYSSRPATLMAVLAVIACLLNSGSIYEVTVRRLREKLVREHQEKEGMLRRLSQLEAPYQIGLVVSKIAHDLRGPLGALKGFVRLMAEEQGLSEEAKQDCSVMTQEIDRLAALVNHMLDCVRPSGKTPVQVIDPREAIEPVLAVLRFHPGAERLRFEPSFPLEALRVRASKEDLQQLFFNVLKNSMEAMEGRPHPRSVEIKVSRDGEAAQIAFKDNGRGIPPDVLKRLSSEPVTTKGDGTGLGLLIAREIVRSHRGEMRIESVEGVGTKVSFRFPLAERPQPQGAST